MALYDALQKRQQKNQQQALNVNAGPSIAQTTSDMLGTKTGKSTAGTSGPKASNLAEGAANDAATLGVNQAASEAGLAAKSLGVKEQAQTADVAAQEAALASQARVADTQLAAGAASAREANAQRQTLGIQSLQSREEMEVDRISSAAEQKINALLSEKKVSEDTLFQQFSHDNRELAYRRDAAQLESLAQTLALRDKAYLQTIDAVGREKNLQDEIAFRKESQDLILGEDLSQVISQLGWTEADLQSQRDFATRMATLDINSAAAILDAQLRSKATTQAISGIGTLATQGVGAAADKGYFTATPQDPNGPLREQPTAPAQPNFSVVQGFNPEF